VRPQRRAFRTHAVPIQTNAAIQTQARTGSGANNATTTAPFGSHHAKTLVRASLTQSCATWSAFSDMSFGRVTERCFGSARTCCLHRRAWHRPVRAEHAAIARFWFKPLATTRTGIEELARVSWHAFELCRAAFWTRDYRFKVHSFCYHTALSLLAQMGSPHSLLRRSKLSHWFLRRQTLRLPSCLDKKRKPL